MEGVEMRLQVLQRDSKTVRLQVVTGRLSKVTLLVKVIHACELCCYVRHEHHGSLELGSTLRACESKNNHGHHRFNYGHSVTGTCVGVAFNAASLTSCRVLVAVGDTIRVGVLTTIQVVHSHFYNPRAVKPLQ